MIIYAVSKTYLQTSALILPQDSLYVRFKFLFTGVQQVDFKRSVPKSELKFKDKEDLFIFENKNDFHTCFNNFCVECGHGHYGYSPLIYKFNIPEEHYKTHRIVEDPGERYFNNYFNFPGRCYNIKLPIKELNLAGYEPQEVNYIDFYGNKKTF